MTLTLRLPIDLSNSNTGRGHHWAASSKRRKEYERIITTLYGKAKPPDCRQRLSITRILGKGQRFYDPDSLGRGAAKELVCLRL